MKGGFAEGGGGFGGGGRGTNERPGSDHMISGPIRGLKKTTDDGADTQRHGIGDSITELAQLGRFSENCPKTCVQ